MEAVLQRSGGTLFSSAVVARAQELVRLLALKPPVRQISPLLQSVVCLDLASAPNLEPEVLMRLAAESSRQKYRSARNRIRLMLAPHLTRTTPSLKKLTIKFGCPQLLHFTKAFLRHYLATLKATSPANVQKYVDEENPVYQAAGLFVCASNEKIRIDKLVLCDLVKINLKEFNTACFSMEKLCKSMLETRSLNPIVALKNKGTQNIKSVEDDDTNVTVQKRPTVKLKTQSRIQELIQYKKQISQREQSENRNGDGTLDNNDTNSTAEALKDSKQDENDKEIEYARWKSKVLELMKKKKKDNVIVNS